MISRKVKENNFLKSFQFFVQVKFTISFDIHFEGFHNKIYTKLCNISFYKSENDENKKDNIEHKISTVHTKGSNQT